jgi:hypothetical protein
VVFQKERLALKGGVVRRRAFGMCLVCWVFLTSCADEDIPCVQPPPPNATLGRIEGVFAHVAPSRHPSIKEPAWTCHLFRFYPDGIVFGKSYLLKTESVVESWPSISKHCTRDQNFGLLNKYYVLGDRIWFRTQSKKLSPLDPLYPDFFPKIDYWGTFTEHRMTLNSYSHKTKSERRDVEYSRVPIQ